MSNLSSELALSGSIWEEYAPAYAKVVSHITFYSDSVDRIVESVKGYHPILDLGCGPGIVSEKLAEKGHKIVSVDSDNVMFEYASKRLKKYPNVRLVKQDIHSLAFDNETFEGVVCNNVLYYVQNPLQVMQECYNTLKPGGIFVVAGPRPNPDLGLLFQTMMDDLEQKGLLAEFSREIEVIIACNRILAERHMRNVYTNEQLVDILTNKIGFIQILESGGCFLSQSYFIVAKKEG